MDYCLDLWFLVFGFWFLVFGLSCCHTASNPITTEIFRFTGFLILVCSAATQLATQLRQKCIQVVCSNKEARKRLTESNGTPRMDLGHMNFVLNWYYVYFLFYDCCFEVDEGFGFLVFCFNLKVFIKE